MSTQFAITIKPHSENIAIVAGFRLFVGAPVYGRDDVWSGVVIAGRQNRSVFQSRAWRLYA